MAVYEGLVTYSYAQYITADHCWSEVRSADQWSVVPVVRSTISADHIISLPAVYCPYCWPQYLGTYKNIWDTGSYILLSPIIYNQTYHFFNFIFKFDFFNEFMETPLAKEGIKYHHVKVFTTPLKRRSWKEAFIGDAQTNSWNVSFGFGVDWSHYWIFVFIAELSNFPTSLLLLIGGEFEKILQMGQSRKIGCIFRVSVEGSCAVPGCTSVWLPYHILW